MDNKLLEKRLLYRESGVGLAIVSVNKCARSFADLLTVKESSNRDRAIDGLVRDVCAYQFDMKVVAGSLQAFREELVEYKSQEETLQRTQAEVQDDILRLNGELEEERLLRSLRAECESKAAVASTLPNQRVLKRMISEAENGLTSTREAIADAESRIQKRLKVLEEIGQLLDVLKTQIPEEERACAGTAEEEESDDEPGREDDARRPAYGAAEGAVPKETYEEEVDEDPKNDEQDDMDISAPDEEEGEVAAPTGIAE